MREWGKHGRCGRHYSRLTPLVWCGYGWAGCVHYSRHMTWRSA